MRSRIEWRASIYVMRVKHSMGMFRDKTNRGRGAVSNPTGRYERYQHVPLNDGWEDDGDDLPVIQTTVQPEQTRTIITRNDSPDVPFNRSINPYRGCEHGCIYCFARVTHAYLGLSPGIDFESRIFSKPDAAKLLEKELSRPGYRCEVLVLGANTDPYQPVEKRLRITRNILEVLAEHEHPVAIVTKSNLVLRDIDVLGPMAEKRLVHVMLSLTTLDRELARNMEPRAPTPETAYPDPLGTGGVGDPRWCSGFAHDSGAQ